MDEKDKGNRYFFMPKLKPITEKLRAIDNAQKYIDNGLNQTRMAEILGKHPSTINRNVNRLPVQSELQKAFRKEGISIRYKAKKFKKLLEQKKLQDCDVFIKDENGKLKVNRNSNDFIEVEDGNVQLGALKLLCQVEGDIKENGNGKGVNATIVIRIGNQSGLLSPTETSLIPHQRSEI